MKLVVALGGNALIQKEQKGSVFEQFANARTALQGIIELVKEGHQIVLTHGNGPQVGNILIRSQLAKDEAYGIPLGVAVAQSQGEIGYMLEQCLQNKLGEAGIFMPVCCILTQVIVSKNDPSVKSPSKPIGMFLSEKEALKLEKQNIPVIEDAGRGWRRIVSSPKPLEIVEKKEIQKLIDEDVIVIACGGGGIPVYWNKKDWLEGMDAVIDKDLSSAVLAKEIEADELIILTAVEKVYLNFKKPNQKELNEITVSEAKKFLNEGHFAKGSMEPKIQASINFLESGGKKVIISSIEKCFDAFKGKTGTRIVP
ncbi:MAG: carbamate kinase [Candidatus Diapherotrites archaeon]